MAILCYYNRRDVSTEFKLLLRYSKWKGLRYYNDLYTRLGINQAWCEFGNPPFRWAESIDLRSWLQDRRDNGVSQLQ